MSVYVRRHWAFGIFLLAMAFAIAVRMAWSPEPGHQSDISIFLRWMRSILEFGFRDSYAHQVDGGSQPNYPPVALLLLGTWAHVIHDVLRIDLSQESITLTMLMKFIANAADIGGAIVLYVALRAWGKHWIATAGAAAYALNPAMMYNSAVWGQIDALYTVFMVFVLVSLVNKAYGSAGANTAMALMSKVQAVAIGPVFAYSFFRMPTRGKLRSILAFALATVAFFAPFVSWDSIEELAWVYTSAVGQQSHLTSYAYNLWWVFYGDAGPDLPSTLKIWGPFDARTIGISLFAITCIVALVQLHARLRSAKNRFDQWTSYSLASAIISWGFYLWNTEAHERFLYPFCAIGIGMLFISYRYAVVYLLVCGLYYFNLTGYVPFGTLDRYLFATYPAFDVWISIVNVSSMVFVLVTACLEDIGPYLSEVIPVWYERKTGSRPKSSRTPSATRA